MPKIVFNAAVIFGDPLSPAPTTTTVTVTNLATSALADLWEDRAGTTPLDNPFEIDNPGIIKFYSDGGRFEIEAENGSSTAVWPDHLQIDPDASEYTNTPETTTARTLSLDDHKKCIVCSNASGCAITVPPQASVAWADNTEIIGVGELGNITFNEGESVEILIPYGRLLECYKGAPWALRRLATNKWVLAAYLLEV